MNSVEQLRKTIGRIDGKGYKAYQDLRGEFDFGDFVLFCDHIQGDPFAAPSRVRVRVSQNRARFPRELFASLPRRSALADFLARQVGRAIGRHVKGRRGTGKSGMITIDRGGQEILPRTAVVVTEQWVEARLSLGLPAAGRTILGREAEAMLLHELPRVVEEGLLYARTDREQVKAHVDLAEDQEWIRERLEGKGLVAFVGNGAVLPRISGVSDAPLPAGRVVPFTAPPSLEVEFRTPNNGLIMGMGIPRGVTLIVGGGFHGKSTLLRALERGVYNHIPGDGREWVITVGDAVKIRAEDGRRVEKVDISPFINNLPFGMDTTRFVTDDASGSTSQAANIMEALEVGCSLLLLDEDTSATNFMIRDARMQQLVAKEKEPITPFIDRVRELYRDLGVSTVMVVGGSGDYFDVADTVIMMDEYRAIEVTEHARKIAGEHVSHRRQEATRAIGGLRARVPHPDSFDPSRGGRTKLSARGLDEVVYGTHEVNLHAVEQLVDLSQTRAVAEAIHYASRKYCDGKRDIPAIIDLVLKDVALKGLDVISPYYGQHPGDLALPRKHEIAAVINRLRSLKIL